MLPITRDDRVLLTKEKRGKVEAYGLIGGSARPGETDFKCMSREAKEDSGGALSLVTLARIAEGRGVLGGGRALYERVNSVAVKHDLVHRPDFDVDARFDAGKAAAMRTSRATIKKKKAKPPAVQLALEFVPMAQLRDWEWRSKNMHHVASVLAARLLKL